MPIEIKTDGDSSPRVPPQKATPAAPAYPVARPAVKAPQIKPGAEPEEADLVEDLLSPPSIKSFAWSIAGHTLFLLILAFWYFSPPSIAPKIFDTRLAGSEFGDESGDQIKGGLGMDTPLAMPEAPLGPTLNEAEKTLTTIPVPELTTPSPNAARPKASAAANGGGVNLTNPGQGGSGDGFGVAKFGHGGENINGVEVKVGDPQFTLIWDSRADIDLHVVEPGGSEIYWENRNGAQGGELDVDDVDGFGPENINYVQGKGPPGTYTWFVHYYGGLGGLAQQTRWKVRVKHANKTDVFQGKFNAIGQKSQIFKLKVAPDQARVADTATNPRDTPEGGVITPPANPLAARPPIDAMPPPVPAGPRIFSPPGGGFSVMMPGEPKAGRKDWETPLGPAVAQVYSMDTIEGGLAVTTFDFPAAVIAKADSSKMLDDFSTKVVSENKGTSTRQVKNALNGAPGREAEFTLPESVVAGGGLGKARTYLVGNRVVVASAVGTKAFVDGPDTDAFFKSLKLSEDK